MSYKRNASTIAECTYAGTQKVSTPMYKCGLEVSDKHNASTIAECYAGTQKVSMPMR